MKLDVQKYLENSTIHGLSYISRRYHLIIRIFWTVALILSAICTLTLMVMLAVKLKNFPIVVYLSDIAVPISEINFPAVTVCPDFIPFRPFRSQKGLKVYMPVKYEKHTAKFYYYEYIEYLEDTEDERKFTNRINKFNYMKFLSMLESGEIKSKKLGIKILKRLQIVDLITKRGVFQKLNLSVPADDFLEIINEFQKEFLFSSTTFGFHWLENNFQYVSEIITSHGLCYTFNMAFLQDVLNLTSTSKDFHFQLLLNSVSRYGYTRLPENLPRKTLTSLSGLYVDISVNYDWYTKSSIEVITSDVNGFELFFHDPYELPSSRTKSIFIKNNRYSVIEIEAQLNSMEASLEDYNPVDRNCYLDDERKLKYFKKYTKLNCFQECLSDYMISRCGCVEFFMIRNSTTRICRGNEKNCFDNARNDFESQKNSCGCLQPCNHIKYDFEVSEIGFISDAIWTSNKQTINEIGVNILYKDSKFNRLIRKQQFSFLDFLSFAGGLLGLFAGFSVLSFVELIYWFTARVVFIDFNRTSSSVVSFHRNEQLAETFQKNSIFVEFLKDSSIHGLQYVSKVGRLDKVLWGFFLTISMAVCFFLISQTRKKVPDSRIIAFDDNLKFVDDIIFPAITIIPEFYIREEIGHAVCSEQVNEDISYDALRYAILCAFCSEYYEVYFKNHTGIDLKPFVLDMLKEKSRRDWFQQQISILNGRYKPMYAEIRTDRGMGFTFGLIDADQLLNYDLIHENFQFVKNVTTKSQENITKTVDNLSINNRIKAELNLKLKKIKTSEQICMQLGVAVHGSETIPTFYNRAEFLALQYGTDLNIDVTPEIITTDENLKHLSPQVRECFFDDEKKLKFFKKYSQQNCIIECLADLIFKRCNCTDFGYPFEQPKFCNGYDVGFILYCPSLAKSEFYQQDPTSSDHKCSCLPTCNTVTYHIKYFQMTSKDNESISINLRINTEDIILYRRYQQFTFSDVVSYVGGLLGLFAGISMLSIVEIFYFFTIRIAVNIYKL